MLNGCLSLIQTLWPGWGTKMSLKARQIMLIARIESFESMSIRELQAHAREMAESKQALLEVTNQINKGQ